MNPQIFLLRFEKSGIKGNQRKGTSWSTESLSNSVSWLGLLGFTSASLETDTAISFYLLWLQTHRVHALARKMVCLQFTSLIQIFFNVTICVFISFSQQNQHLAFSCPLCIFCLIQIHICMCKCIYMPANTSIKIIVYCSDHTMKEPDGGNTNRCAKGRNFLLLPSGKS